MHGWLLNPLSDFCVVAWRYLISSYTGSTEEVGREGRPCWPAGKGWQQKNHLGDKIADWTVRKEGRKGRVEAKGRKWERERWRKAETHNN